MQEMTRGGEASEGVVLRALLEARKKLERCSYIETCKFELVNGDSASKVVADYGLRGLKPSSAVLSCFAGIESARLSWHISAEGEDALSGDAVDFVYGDFRWGPAARRGLLEIWEKGRMPEGFRHQWPWSWSEMCPIISGGDGSFYFEVPSGAVGYCDPEGGGDDCFLISGGFGELVEVFRQLVFAGVRFWQIDANFESLEIVENVPWRRPNLASVAAAREAWDLLPHRQSP